jgi:hypothetical protein
MATRGPSTLASGAIAQVTVRMKVAARLEWVARGEASRVMSFVHEVAARVEWLRA